MNELLEGYKWIPGYEDSYSMNEYGVLMSYMRLIPKIRKPFVTNCGYAQAHLSKDSRIKTFYVQRLVALLFIGPRGDLEVNHKDSNKLNNHYSNLEYTTRSGNLLHSYKAKGGNNYFKWRGIKRPVLSSKNGIGEYFPTVTSGCLSGFNPSLISKACRKHCTHGGFLWAYIDNVGIA